MLTAAQILRTIRIWVVLAVVLADCVLLHLLPGPWNYYWLFAVGCSVVLNLYWARAARNTKLVLGSPILWLVSVAEFLLYSLPLSSVPILGQRLAPRFAAVEIVGAVMCAFGVGFAIWSRRVLAANWSNDVTLRDCHALVQDGPYAIIRHPIYFGFMMTAVGMILVLAEVRALVLLLDIVVFFRRMKPEERILRATYPNEYPEYERRVKRLFPCIW
jgi:protein-S-isoprenylcysteine O-methyltransferase Ste14